VWLPGLVQTMLITSNQIVASRLKEGNIRC
jgi:hypothetical protein